jgi:DNA mismatch endonuclease (patch repair protein)
VDTVSKATRSRIMAAVKPFGNKTTERAMARVLWAHGVRGYRKHWRVLGKPDFAWPGLKVAVFVDGCFWHGCPCCRRIPSSNTDFWDARISGNKARDRRVSRKLRRDGWMVIRVWECRVHSPKALDRISASLAARRADAAS